jgi:serine/threonine-protein kinase
MGSVYLARIEGAAGFRKPVVIKAIHDHLMDDHNAIEAFAREARLAVRLSHPNIVAVLDFGQHDGQYVMILDYVHGRHLGQLFKHLVRQDRQIELEHAAYLIYQVLRGLEFAHGLTNDRGEPLGLVHRDISPQNILISTNGDVKLTDFGIASVQTEVTRSGKGDLKGKLAYLSPEQVSAKPAEQRSDLFAVGTVFYELLSGQRLFHAESEAQTIMRIHQAQVPDIRDWRPDLPEAVMRVLARALAKSPEDRFKDAASFAGAVRALLDGASPDEVEPSFRQMIARTLAEPALDEVAGPLPELPRELEGPPISLSKTSKAATDDSFTHTVVASPSPGRSRMGLVLALGVGVALIAALVAGGVLILAGRSGGPPPSAPVSVIIENRRDDPPAEPAADASALPSTTTETDASPAEPVLDAALEPVPDDPPPPVVSGVPNDTPDRPLPRTLDGQLVTRTFMRQRSALQSCFERGAAGVRRVTVRLEIAGDGSVSWAALEPAGAQGSPLGQCLLAVARRTHFPRHSGTGLVYRVPISVEEQ